MPVPKKMVTKSGETRWKVRFRDGDTNASETFATKKHGEDFCALIDAVGGTRARAIINEHDAETVITITLGEMLDRWLEWKSAKRPDGSPLRVESPYTLTRYEQLIRLHIKPALGDLMVNLVSEKDVQDWADALAGQRSRKVLADAHSLLHAAYTWANSKKVGLALIDPCTDTDLPKKGKRVVKGLKPDEWKILHAAALEVDQNAADILLFLVYSGWRWSEAVAVRSQDVDDYGDDGVYVTMGRILRRVGNQFEFYEDDAKSQAGVRVVKMGEVAAEMIRRRRKGLKPGDLLFTTRRQTQWSYSSFHSDIWTYNKLKQDGPGTRRRILQLAEDKGLSRASEVTLHWLRHTHAALMVLSGESMAAVQKRLGHEDIRTTIGTYGGMISDVSDVGLSRLDKLLDGAPPAIGA